MAGRRFTITLPDGSIATRLSQSNVYTHGVVIRTDNHARAVNADRLANVLARYHAEVVATVASGDLSVFARRKSSYSMAAGYSYSSYLPWANAEPLWVEWAEQFSRAKRNVRPAEYAPWLPDWQDADAWAKYADGAIGRMPAEFERATKEAAELRALPQYSWGVIRWSQSLTNAMKATGSAELGATDRTVLLTVQPVDA